MARPAACIAPRIVRRANELVAQLRRRKLTIVTAESCTGGLISAALSQGDGASEALHGSFVTYSKQQKTAALGVRRAELRRETAVSRRVAASMARGARRRSKADVALAVTGVLGPAPDEDGNPVGFVAFALDRPGGAPRTTEIRFGRMSHDRLRCRTILAALEFTSRNLPARRSRRR
jgi:nicotinamide-nucleotide amidase